MKPVILVAFAVCASSVSAQRDPHFHDGRSTIVHLFEWKWSDIAAECENFLSKKGFGGVQISPPSENAVVDGRPWWEKYQPVSYVLSNRAGDENALADMLKRCNNVGVRVYADLVVNHMATSSDIGTAGNSCNPDSKYYPAVSYTSENFHPGCRINYSDATSIRNCELSGLKDLDQSQDYVRGKIIDYINHLISLGVAGFRVDAAKHMWPSDLSYIFGRLNNLNTDHGFDNGARAFFFQEVINTGSDPIDNKDYTGFGRVCEFKYGMELSNCFRGKNPLHYLENWGTGWGLLDGGLTVAFIENHDTQRGNGSSLNYKEAKAYKAAIAFMQAHPYEGITRIFSGYYFDNADQAPPVDGDQIKSPEFTSDGTCTNGWTCEHRWSPIFNMVEFRNTVAGTALNNWWTNGDNQIAFSRGDKGFYTVTLSGNINTSIPTGLSSGTYCDVISGNLINGSCSGKTVTVNSGRVNVQLSSEDIEVALAIHVNAKL